jgi:DNA-directed RNA polymerase alpha subunit
MGKYRKLCADLVRYWDADDQFAFINTLEMARWALRDGVALSAIDMPAELYNPLRRGGYKTLEQVLEAEIADLLKIKGLGPDRVGRIKACVRRHMIKEIKDGST